MSKVYKRLIIALMLLSSLVFSILQVFSLGEYLSKAVEKYPQNSQLVSFYNLPAEKSSASYRALEQFVLEHKAVMVREDVIRSSTDQGSRGKNIGIVGDIAGHGSDLTLSFLGNEILNVENLTRLQESGKGKTLGLDISQTDLLEPLTGFPDIYKLTVRKMDDLIESSTTVIGNYSIVGLTPDEYDELITMLQGESGLPKDSLMGANHAEMAMDYFAIDVLKVVTGVLVFALAFIVIMAIYSSYKTIGVYLLLGWSQKDFARKHFQFLLGSSLLSIPIIIGVFFTVSEGFSLSNELVFFFIKGFLCIGLLALLLYILVLCLFSAVPPVKALKQQVSRKPILAILTIVFLLSTAGLVFGIHQLDGPMEEFKANKEISQSWQEVSGLSILEGQKIGDDQSSINRQSTQLYQDYYHWYQSIEGKPGVYLCNTRFYGEDLLAAYRRDRTYDAVPEKAFWCFAVSPNYIRDQGVQVDEALVQEAEEGKRVYLIPDSYSETEKAAMIAWLKENSLRKLEGDIKTPFMEKPLFDFVDYSCDQDLFNWSTDTSMSNRTRDPVIYIAHTNNMTWVENESLSAVGLANSYIKLNAESRETWLQAEYLAKYHLDDNAPNFLPVEEFVAGLQKSLKTFMQFFGALVLIVSLINLVIILGMLKLFSDNYRDQVAVKRLLGYSLTNIYKPVFLLVLITGAFAIIASFLMRSRFAPVYMSITLLLQLLILSAQSRKISMRTISGLIKE